MRIKSILVLLAILLGLGGTYYYVKASKPVDKPEPQLYVWMIEMDDIQHIQMSLPREDKSQAFIKEVDRSWHFDDPQRSEVDMQRWGGGIPLLLSGPGVDRVIARDATEEKLTEYGLTQPRMEIKLYLADGTTLDIKVGDSTPNGSSFYIQAPGSNDVATVDITWYQVFERLIKEPPYASAAAGGK